MTTETLFSGLRKSRISATNVLTIFVQRSHMQAISVPTRNFVRKFCDSVNSIRNWSSGPWNNTKCYWRNTKKLSKSTAIVHFDCEVGRLFIVNFIFLCKQEAELLPISRRVNYTLHFDLNLDSVALFLRCAVN